MRSKNKTRIGRLFLLLFVFAITPQDLLHLFAHHDENTNCYSRQTVVSTPHTHCASLNLEVNAFTAPAKATLPLRPFFVSTLVEPEYSINGHCLLPYSPTRGPPALC